MSLLDPKGFQELKNCTLTTGAFFELSKKLIQFDERATPENLSTELLHLANNWNNLKKYNLDAYLIEKDVPEEDEVANEDEAELHDVNSSELLTCKELCKSCNNCCICCFRLLSRYNLLTGCYSTLGLAYKFLLTLSFTQVACERSFSVLKHIKNRLRSSLSQSKLEAFMLMSSENEILMKLDVSKIIDEVADTSKLLQSKLKF